MSTYRTRLTVLAMVALLGLVPAGCKSGPGGTGGGSGNSPAPSAAAGASPAVGALGAASAGPSASAGGASTVPVNFPHDAASYAQAVLKAFLAGQNGVVNQLTTSNAQQVLDDGRLRRADRHWHYHTCDGPDIQMCAFYNDAGDTLTLYVDPQRLGRSEAVNDAVIQAIEYSKDANQYVTEYLQAWVDGNQLRMGRLATSDVNSYFAGLKQPVGWNLADEGTAGHTHVRITDSSGFDQTVDVTNQLLGGQHAITGVCNPSCP